MTFFAPSSVRTFFSATLAFMSPMVAKNERGKPQASLVSDFIGFSLPANFGFLENAPRGWNLGLALCAAPKLPCPSDEIHNEKCSAFRFDGAVLRRSRGSRREPG